MPLITTKLFILFEAFAQLLRKVHQSDEIICTVIRKKTHAYT